MAKRRTDPSRSSRFDLVGLEQALLVLDHGSFRKAAETLGVRPSVVSRRVSNLEDMIGVSLFSRTSKGVQSTVAGNEFLRRGRIVVADIASLVAIGVQNGRVAAGRLRLGIVASIASSFAHDLLESFLADFPDVELEVVEGSLRENTAAVRALLLDFAFVSGMPLCPGCELEELWRERVFVALHTRHPLASHAYIAWRELDEERFIVSRGDPGPEIQDYIIRGLADLGRHPVVAQVAVQRETLLGMVGLGQGLSLVGEAEAGVIYPGVVFRPLEHEEIPFSIVWSSRNDNPAFRRFLSLSRNRAAARSVSRISSRAETASAAS